MALTPPNSSYASIILSTLTSALAQNRVTPLGRQLTIDTTYVTNAVTQDPAPYTCK
jgi:hypothetical protein